MDQILNKIKTILDPELPLISNLSNASAILNDLDNINWCGFYLVDGDKLVLGPFQGEVACSLIKFGKGVCGTSYQEKRTLIVPDVNKFPGHIACSSASKSEIVTPIIKNYEVVGVIDIDAPILDRFHEEDKILLEAIAEELSKYF